MRAMRRGIVGVGVDREHEYENSRSEGCTGKTDRKIVIANHSLLPNERGRRISGDEHRDHSSVSRSTFSRARAKASAEIFTCESCGPAVAWMGRLRQWLMTSAMTPRPRTNAPLGRSQA